LLEEELLEELLAELERTGEIDMVLLNSMFSLKDYYGVKYFCANSCQLNQFDAACPTNIPASKAQITAWGTGYYLSRWTYIGSKNLVMATIDRVRRGVHQ
jgi:hypothetical protein